VFGPHVVGSVGSEKESEMPTSRTLRGGAKRQPSAIPLGCQPESRRCRERPPGRNGIDVKLFKGGPIRVPRPRVRADQLGLGHGVGNRSAPARGDIGDIGSDVDDLPARRSSI